MNSNYVVKMKQCTHEMLLFNMLLFSNTTPIKVLPQHGESEGSSDPVKTLATGKTLS